MKKTTAEEKRLKLLSAFHENFDFYNLKEVEKMASKKGISSQLVKDILQQLIDDDLVSCEKIGNKNIYFSFPATKDKIKKKKLNSLVDENKKFELEIENLEKRIEIEKSKRTMDTNEYDELRIKKEEMESKLGKYSNIDPEMYEKRKNQLQKLKNNINEVTDQIFCVQSYVTNKFPIDKSQFNSSFGVDDEMDYIE